MTGSRFYTLEEAEWSKKASWGGGSGEGAIKSDLDHEERVGANRLRGGRKSALIVDNGQRG